MIGAWHVAFEPRGWFGHVLAFGFDGSARVWVVIDPARHVTDVTVMDPLAFDAWIEQRARGAEIFRIDTREQTSVLSPGLWCVGTVKRLVGLRSGALSPAGLRRDLIEAGATRVFVRPHASESDPRGLAGQACTAG